MEDLKILEVLQQLKSFQKQKELVDRAISEKIIKIIGKEVITIFGVRRSGKSSLLILLMKKLNLKDSQILYVNFDDPVFINYLDIQLLDKIWEIYRINVNLNEKPYLFFDEIQVVPKWEKWIRRMRDLEQAYIFITGSSSKLFSREFGTSLTGRHISFFLYPLSFQEFILFKGYKLPENDLKIIENRILLKKLFQDYLYNGGFPEIVLSGKNELLKEYFEDILFKDIIIRYEVRDVNTLRKLATYCLTNVSNFISYNSLKNIFKISLDKVKSYLSYLEESFLIFFVQSFSYSLKSQELSPKKVYCIDNGLRNAVSFKFSKDEGKLLENLIFLDLKRREKEIHYWRNKNEVDFVIKNIDDSLTAINISYSDDIEEREINGLKEFKNIFISKVRDLFLITKDIEQQKNGITFVPIWKWLLKENF